MKKNCWKILGIEPTNDLEIIKNAYKMLIKKYHPDTVRQPEKKIKYTNKTIQIIDAYKEAIKEAENKSFRNNEIRTDIRNNIHKTNKSEFVFTIIIFIIICVIITDAKFKYLHNLSNTNPIKIVFNFILSIFAGYIMAFVFGVSILWWVFVISLLLEYLLSKLKLEKYTMKLSWLILLFFNIYIFYFSDFLGYDEGFYSQIARAIAAFLFPAYFLFEYIYNLIIYKRINIKKYPDLYNMQKITHNQLD